jgi:ADP-ribosylglycohydrolase
VNSIPYFAGWDPARSIVEKEVAQLAEEGRDPQWIAKLLATVNLEQADPATLAGLWSHLQDAPVLPDFPFIEPSGLEEIRAERIPAPRQFSLSLPEKELADRMLGAWLGRCCGCALGKPVECFMEPRNGLSSKQRLKSYLLGVAPDEYPLRDYFPGSSSAQETTGKLFCEHSQREKIAFMETDDDIRYTVLGQKILLEKGAGFTTLDVMETWIHQLPYALVCTAETQAYRNFVLLRPLHPGPAPEPDWTWVATHQNPYREWIGAQIRADSWGYAAPGHPELAADFAWRDARMSHVKNGIYGEMFVAAMIAAGFALNDPLKVVQAGLAEIPRRSRLYAEMEQVIEICRQHQFSYAAFEQVLDEIYALLGHYDPVHTNNNAALVVAALLLGQRDFEKVITLAVMGGWDTDCNGATAGSIFGAMHGAQAIPAKWSGPLHDTLYSQIFGYHPIAISECARRSHDLARKINPAL